jgi:hypothetical protein
MLFVGKRAASLLMMRHIMCRNSFTIMLISSTTICIFFNSTLILLDGLQIHDSRIIPISALHARRVRFFLQNTINDYDSIIIYCFVLNSVDLAIGSEVLRLGMPGTPQFNEKLDEVF